MEDVTKVLNDVKKGRKSGSKQLTAKNSKSASKKTIKSKDITLLKKKSSDDGIKKKRRFKPGTRANMEIRRLQTGKDKDKRCFKKAPLARLIRQILSETGGEWRITPQTFDTLLQAAEQQLIELFVDTNRITTHNKRVEINIDDFKLANELRNDRNPYASTLANPIVTNGLLPLSSLDNSSRGKRTKKSSSSSSTTTAASTNEPTKLKKQRKSKKNLDNTENKDNTHNGVNSNVLLNMATDSLKVNSSVSV